MGNNVSTCLFANLAQQLSGKNFGIKDSYFGSKISANNMYMRRIMITEIMRNYKTGQ
nr:hypothetical protein [Thalassospira profundimaris]